MGGMTSQPSPHGPLVMLGTLAALLLAAGMLPWLAGGSAAARGFAAPLLLVGAFAGYAVVRAGRAPPAGRPGRQRPAQGGQRPFTGCAGCVCGAGRCLNAEQ